MPPKAKRGSKEKVKAANGAKGAKGAKAKGKSSRTNSRANSRANSRSSSSSSIGAPAAAAAAPAIGSKESLVRAATRIGGNSGINWAALDKANKRDSVMNTGSPSPKKSDDHSKIYKALNPEKLWKESKKEKKDADKDENVMFVHVRGADVRTVLDQKMYTRDDTGAVIDDEENDAGGRHGHMVESGTIGFEEMEDILAKNREAREADGKKRQLELRRKSQIKTAEEQKRIATEMQKIEKREAALKKKTSVTDADVKKVQQKLEKELEFEEFGFGNL